MSSRSDAALLLGGDALIALAVIGAAVMGAGTPWRPTAPDGGGPAARAATVVAGAGVAAPLRVCADPNNLPFSNEKAQGFENRIAALIARDLGTQVRYTWWPQRRGFVRNTLAAGRCDVVMGVPAHYDPTLTTRPYYRSSYVFVTRAGRQLAIRSFADPALRGLRIGVHMMGDDYANSPAAMALARHGLGPQLVPFMIYGDYSQADPPARLVRAVAADSIDVAVAWGPLAGWYARRSPVPLTVTPVEPDASAPRSQFVFDIALGVRHGDTARRAWLDRELVRRRADIRRILDDYGVPRLADAAPGGR